MIDFSIDIPVVGFSENMLQPPGPPGLRATQHLPWPARAGRSARWPCRLDPAGSLEGGSLQETHGFLPSNIGVSCKFSHHPTLWLSQNTHCCAINWPWSQPILLLETLPKMVILTIENKELNPPNIGICPTVLGYGCELQRKLRNVNHEECWSSALKIATDPLKI